MNSDLKKSKIQSFVILGTAILLAAVIIYSVSVKRNVEVQIPDYFFFKATD